jgi:AhpC/TSA family/Thiol:disulfide interchange protein DsbD, N-terminal
MENSGVRIAAISYDSTEALKRFSDEQGIGFPLLSDRDSAVIRRFGIFNHNIAAGLRAHGVPHPVNFFIAPDGTVIRKYFVENYQHRVTGAAVVLREFGTVADGAELITLKGGALTVQIGLSGSQAFAGQEISFFANFQLEPEWHVYGTPLPAAYTATSVTFDDPNIIRQSFELPEARPLTIPALGETLPVYSGSFRGLGALLLKFPIDAGRITLAGQLRFQECSDTVCEAPEAIPFELPLTIEQFMIPKSRPPVRSSSQ